MIKETLVLAALAISSPAVVDGDTVRIAGVSIRLTDYDAPELFSPKWPREHELAWKAKVELERIIGQVKLELVPCATSNWGRLRRLAVSREAEALSAARYDGYSGEP